MDNKDEPPTNDIMDPRKGIDPKRPKVLSREVYYKGKIIIHQGDIGHRAYFIERGHVEVLVTEGKHQLKLAEMGQGAMFGEMALITKEPRSATVRALDETVLTVISREEVEGKIGKIADPAIRALINVLAERLRNSTLGQMSQFKTLSEFQDRVSGMVNEVQGSLDEKDRAGFSNEVAPLLADLQKIIDRYHG
jgi:CRP/FNR family cyclic AMP-dependent transcriptional regulator